MNTANKLTIFRIILVLPFIILLAMPITTSGGVPRYENVDANLLYFIFAGLVFIIAMITDFLDGYIARKTKTITTFGKLYDPIADKFMTTSALIMFAVYRIVPIWIVIIFVLRDIFVDGLRNVAAKNNENVAATFFGKLKTMIQSIGIILVFFIVPVLHISEQSFNNFAWSNTWKLILINIPIFIATALSLTSGYGYMQQIKKFIKLK